MATPGFNYKTKPKKKKKEKATKISADGSRIGGKFAPGHSGNPVGRPIGNRNRLGEGFLGDLRRVWEKKGEACLDEAIAKEPMQFAKMIAGLLPKELLVSKAPTDGMSDEELAGAIDALAGLATHLGANPGSTRKVN